MILKNIIIFCLKIIFTFTNSVDPDEMQYNAAFHLGLHYLQKNSLSGFPEYKCQYNVYDQRGTGVPFHSYSRSRQHLKIEHTLRPM